MDNIKKRKAEDLSIDIDKVAKKTKGDFKDKEVISPRSPEKKNISKENLKNNITDITNREISSEEEQKEKRTIDAIVNDIKNSKDRNVVINAEVELYELLAEKPNLIASLDKEILFQLLTEALINFEIADNPSVEEKEASIKLLITYFNSPDRLKETDFRGNNAFHYAAKLGSFKAWQAFRDVLDKQNLNQENATDPLTEKNHYNEGDTPWELVLQSPDPDFVKSVLLDELERDPKSPFINDLINQYGEAIKSYTTYGDDEDFIHHYIQHRALLAGNQATIDKLIKESYNQWERKQKETGTSVSSFLKSTNFTDIVEDYDKYTREQLQQAGYKHEILKKTLSDKEYKIENNDILSDYIQYMRESYADWKSTIKTYPIEGFMRTPVYLSIANTILAGGNFKAINALNKTSELYTLKYILEGENRSRRIVESCIINIFKQKDCHRIFEALGYTPQEVVALAKEHAHEIAESGALGNVLMLLSDKCLYNFDQITKFLSVTTDFYGRTPLHYSEMCGHLGADLVMLKKIGFSEETITKFLFIKDSFDETLLRYCEKNGRLGADLVTLKKGGFSDETIEKLLSFAERNGYTLLHYSAENGHLGIDLVTLKRVFSEETITKYLSFTDCFYRKPLHGSAWNGHLGDDLVRLNKGDFSDETIEKLLSFTDGYGQTPLHYSAMNGHLRADLLTLNKGGFSKKQIIKFLSITDKDGKTPLFGKEDDEELTKALQSIGLEESDIKPLHLLWKGNLFQQLLSQWGNLDFRVKAQFFFFAFVLLLVAYYLKPFSKSK